MRVLITGGAGFIGSRIAAAHVALGNEVAIVDDLSTGKSSNIPDGARLYQARCDSCELGRIVSQEQPGLVYHLAAQANVRLSHADPVNDVERNVLGTISLLKACSGAARPVVVFASSGGAVYGEAGRIPVQEEDICRPLSPYGIDKLACEGYVRAWERETGGIATIFRYGNVYGRGQDPHFGAGIISILLDRLRDHQPTVLFGAGDQVRDYVHVADVVSANLLVVARPRSGTFNIATGVGTSLLEVKELIEEVSGQPVEVEFGASNRYEVSRNVLDIRAAKEKLGWKPSIALRDGIGQYISGA